MHDVQNFGNHLKLERTIPLKKSNPLSPQSKYLFQTAAQLIALYYRSVHSDRTIRCDLYNDRFRIVCGSRPLLTDRKSVV